MILKIPGARVLIVFVVITLTKEVFTQEDSRKSLENFKSQPFLAVTTTANDLETARKFARALIEKKLAATVNMFPQTISSYSWNGEIQEVEEVVMVDYLLQLILTHETLYKKLESYIRENHVHVEPGIVSFPISGGSDTFFKWFEDTLEIDWKDRRNRN